MANLKAALIGCGGMGRAHANAGQALGVEVVAFCDVIESAAERAREEFGGRYATTDAGRIMRDDSIDLLYIATHHDAHHPLALAGAQAGKHMMLKSHSMSFMPKCIPTYWIPLNIGLSESSYTPLEEPPGVHSLMSMKPSPGIVLSMTIRSLMTDLSPEARRPPILRMSAICRESPTNSKM